jgi:endonuclease YncB( thermonuclease family)
MKLATQTLFLAAVWAGLSTPAQAAPPKTGGEVQGTVTQVIDGDTLQFTPKGQPALLVRLRDIDAPELCQAGGEQARRALAELALNKPATLRSAGRDGVHVLGTVIVDEVNLGVRQVEEGQAWSLRGRNGHGPLLKQERMAKSLSRGLHGSPGAVPPWDFRKAHGPCA